MVTQAQVLQQLRAAGFGFARVGVAYGFDGTSYADMVPRITSAGLLIEGARSTLITTQVSLANFSPFSVTRTTNSGVAPDGTTTATNLAKSAAVSANTALSGITITNGSTYACSCYFKAASLSSPVLRLYNAGTIDVGITANLGAGTVSTFSGSPTASGIVSIGSGWYRVWFAAALANTSVACYLYPDDPGNAVAGDIYAWVPQLELGAFPSSPIVSGTSRAAESLFAYRSSADMATCTLVLEVTAAPGIEAATTNQSPWSCYAASATTNRWYVYREAATRIWKCRAQSTSPVADQPFTASGSATVADNATAKVAVRFASGNLGVSVNGGAVSSSATAVTPSGMDTERLGDYATTNFWYGYLRRVRRYSWVATDAQLQALSA